MDRRNFIVSTGLAMGSAAAISPSPVHAGQFTGKIRKSLKWSMVKNFDQVSLVDAFSKLRECGFEGVEPSLSHVKDPDAWVAASQASGLIIDGTVGARTEGLIEGLDLTKRIGGDSMLVVVTYDEKRPLVEQWNAARDRLKAAAPHAEKLGVSLLIENVWATFLISPFDMARFIDEVGSPWVQVHFDIGNMMRWGIAEHWAEVLGTRSKKLDIKEFDLPKAMNEGLRKGFDVPLGEGSIQWAAVREELAKIDFRGWAAAEIRGGDWDRLSDISKRMDRVLDL
jgi:hexulose-6-phosphate isomerase